MTHVLRRGLIEEKTIELRCKRCGANAFFERTSPDPEASIPQALIDKWMGLCEPTDAQAQAWAASEPE